MPWSNLEKDIILVQEGHEQTHHFQPDSLSVTPVTLRAPYTPKRQQTKSHQAKSHEGWSARRALLRRATSLISRRSRRNSRLASQN
mmetsp:Transcript_34796/g.78918  ORF Transcript_34796/g.78918 Transcript_34796/m.78918 type:complete len:86 (-) Transcript_34796:625-882(-)